MCRDKTLQHTTVLAADVILSNIYLAKNSNETARRPAGPQVLSLYFFEQLFNEQNSSTNETIFHSFTLCNNTCVCACTEALNSILGAIQ